MPRTRDLGWAQLKIGLVSVFALVMATVTIFLLSGEGGFFWQRYGLKTIFPSVVGLKAGAPVRVAGVEVGSVTDVAFIGDRVEVTMAVGQAHQPRITTRSVASLGSVSVLGEAAVDITAVSQGTPIPEWGYVSSGKGAASLTDVATQAGDGITKLMTLVEDIRNGRGTVGQLFTNDAVYQEMQQLLATAESVAGNIQRGRGTLGRLINDPAAAKALEGSLQNLETMTARIRAGDGSLGRLLNDDAMAKSLSSTTANLESVTGRISRGDGTLGKLVNDQELYTRLNGVTARLDTLVTSLNQGEGTAGRLLHDKQLYDNMNAAVLELKTLIANISKDPRKYLNVRVSLF